MSRVRRCMRGIAVTLVMVASLALAKDAPAQDAEQERTATYREGEAAAAAGKWDVAAEKFRRVVELRSAPKALIALGIAEEHLGKLAEAKQTYEKAVSDARTAGLTDDEAAASRALGDLVPRVPVIVVHVPHADRVTGMSLDGRPIAVRDGEYSVDPGTHTVIAHGELEFREVTQVKEGEHPSVSVDIAPASALRTPAEPARESRPRAGVVIGPIVLGAVGLVGVGVGSALWAVGVGQESDVKSQCGGGTTNCPLSAKPEADAASTNIIAGDVVFGIGAALAVAGATWFIVSTLSHGHPSTIAWASPAGVGMIGRW